MYQLRHPEIALAYAFMDVLVVTSTNRMETFSVVNIEAMAAAVPIVSFGTFGQVKLIESCCAMLFLHCVPVL